MNTMKKHLIVLACLALPLAALAADTKPQGRGGAKKPAPAASAPAPAASAIDSRAAVRASKQRSTSMGACQRQANDQNLIGDARHQFVLTCLAAK